MKKYFLALMIAFSGSAMAQAIFPQVSNFGNQVNVSIWNHTNRDVNCSGWIYITNQQNRTESIHFFERVWRRSHLNRNYRPRTPERIRYVNHNIWCN